MTEQRSYNPAEVPEDAYLWKRRLPRPFEIIYCDRGYLPLPGHPPYNCFCEIEGCKQSVKVSLSGKNMDRDVYDNSRVKEFPKEARYDFEDSQRDLGSISAQRKKENAIVGTKCVQGYP